MQVRTVGLEAQRGTAEPCTTPRHATPFGEKCGLAVHR